MCERLSDDVLTLVQLPGWTASSQERPGSARSTRRRLTCAWSRSSAARAAAWLAQRLARQGQRVAEGDEGQRTLAFFADRVEGNLLAAHQELQKLALLHPGRRAELPSSRSRPPCSTWRATTSGPARARRCWPARWRARCACSTACAPRARPPCGCTGTLAEDMRALARVRDALADGRPLPLAMQEARVWGPRQRALFERVPCRRLADHQLAHLVEAASVCDGVAKGLRTRTGRPNPWDACAVWC
jgi:DNA polymerase III subunit delta